MQIPSGRFAVELIAAGDHHHHLLTLDDHNAVRGSWDNDSQVFTVLLDEHDAKELFWALLAVIPQLRHDRR